LAHNRDPHPLPHFQYVILLKKGKKIFTKGGLSQNPQKPQKRTKETDKTKGNGN